MCINMLFFPNHEGLGKKKKFTHCTRIYEVFKVFYLQSDAISRKVTFVSKKESLQLDLFISTSYSIGSAVE